MLWFLLLPLQSLLTTVVALVVVVVAVAVVVLYLFSTPIASATLGFGYCCC